MFCENCGAPLEPGSRFCTNCGAPVNNVPAAPNRMPSALDPLSAVEEVAKRQEYDVTTLAYVKPYKESLREGTYTPGARIQDFDEPAPKSSKGWVVLLIIGLIAIVVGGGLIVSKVFLGGGSGSKPAADKPAAAATPAPALAAAPSGEASGE